MITRGDVLDVKVLEVDKQRGRIGLKLIAKHENGDLVQPETLIERAKDAPPRERRAPAARPRAGRPRRPRARSGASRRFALRSFGHETPMKTWDAIVVGAGPAGSSTAFRLASAGASVLLLDRAEFPRDKPCGRRRAPRALAHLPVDIAAVVERVPRRSSSASVSGARAAWPRRAARLHDPAAAARPPRRRACGRSGCRVPRRRARHRGRRR